jgi:tryptophanyl-tRNA synthetase
MVIEKKDSAVVITSVEGREGEVILTGDRPTGPLHIGHYVGSLRSRVSLQNSFKQYVLIADAQALTDNAENPQKVRQSVLEVMLDYLAVGIDPEKSVVFVQSAIPETAELMMYFLNLVNLGRLQRNPTVKSEIKEKDFGEGIPVGFLAYPVSQAADISQFKATVVPVGEDQIPMIEQTNEIVRKFNRIYGCSVFKECKAFVTAGGLLPGTDGQSKMGKSLGNAIFLSDSEKEVTRKVKGMYTDPNHLRVEDPGTVEGNPVFTYLDFFDPDKSSLEEMKAHYRRGGLGDGVVKKRLNDVLQEFLGPIRLRREEYAQDKSEVLNVLKKGTEKARQVITQTVKEAKQAMGINYFD